VAYIFLDESGQFTKHNDEQYFIIGSFTTGDPRRTEKRFRSWQRARFPKKLRNQTEIKFSEINITDALRLKTLRMISDLDIRIKYTFLKRENIPEKYRNDGKLSTGILYTQVVGETLELYTSASDFEFRVFCDRRNLKGIKRKEFKDILIARLLPQLPKNPIIQIEMIDSTESANIQIADWVSGALARYHEKKELCEDCYGILKNNIIDSKELFKDYWEDRYKNKKPNRKD
jgi:hypothetical protein